jgi:hypothetical protein
VLFLKEIHAPSEKTVHMCQQLMLASEGAMHAPPDGALAIFGLQVEQVVVALFAHTTGPTLPEDHRDTLDL